MSFKKDFDTLFNAMMTDWQNQFPEADTSQGSLIYIKNACLASALWGLYKYQEWIAKQIFPDTASLENLEHHAYIRGITRKAGEADAELLARLLAYIRQPPAGGTANDYELWALEVTDVTKAYYYGEPEGAGTAGLTFVMDNKTTYPDFVINGGFDTNTIWLKGNGWSISSGKASCDGSQAATSNIEESLTHFTVGRTYEVTFTVSSYSAGSVKPILGTGGTSGTARSANGTFVENIVAAGVNRIIFEASSDFVGDIDDVMIKDKTSTIIPGTSEIATVQTYIDSKRPVTAEVFVIPADVNEQDVTMAVTGDNIDTSQIASEVTAYLNSLEPGQTLYRAQLFSLAVNLGADNVTITIPATDITQTELQMIRPGTINVS